MKRFVGLLLGLALVALVALVWVPPALAGPTIECSGLSQAECGEEVPLAMKHAVAEVPYAGLLPITDVRLSASDGCGVSYVVTWLFGFNWMHDGCPI
jgi:hypothetical protein